MIKNDNEFQEAFKEYVKGYGIETNEIHMCNGLPCGDCILKPISDETYDKSRKTCNVCEERPFQKIKEYEKKIALLKQEISIMSNWKKENKTLTKEELEGEKIYAEIQLLITKNGELTKEIARLYRKLDQIEKGEKKNG